MKNMWRGPARLAFIVLWTIVMPFAAFGGERAPGRVLALLRNDAETVGVSASRLRSAAGGGYVARVAKSAGATTTKTWASLSEARGKIFALMISDTKTTEELIAELKADPRVLAACPDFKVRAFADPDDPYYTNGTLWGMATIRADEAWDETTGSDAIYVAVADTGIYAEHEDLAANVDTALSRNFANGDDPEPATGGSCNDGDGHGTHVSGTIGAVGNNGKGVVGVSWRVKIIALKVLDDEGVGYFSWTLGALDYLVDLLKSRSDLNVAAANFSLGGWAPATPDQMRSDPEWNVYWEAYKALDDLNRTVIVVASGNEGMEVGAPAPYDDALYGYYKKGDYIYPASLTGLDNMIVVGAVDRGGNAPTFNNWSSSAVQLVAPGTDIVSTATPFGKYYGQSGLNYATLRGTSMAAPHVSGAVALLAAKYPDLGAGRLKAALLAGANNAVGTGSVSSHGLLDVKGALDSLSGVVAAQSVSIAPDGDFSLEAGETRQLHATVLPENASDRGVSWGSSNASVATVDDAGLVTAVAAGSARITARASGGGGVEDSVGVTVTAVPTAGYVAVPRSAAVQSQLTSVNARMAARGVYMDFGSLNNAMELWTPGNADQVLLSSIQNATLTEETGPSSQPSGWASTGKPSVVVDMDAANEHAVGKAALLPVTMEYTLLRDELVSLLGTTRTTALLADPGGQADVFFDTLALLKETTTGGFINLVPGSVSPKNAMSAGILTLKGGNALVVGFSFLVADAAGLPSFDGRQLIVPDGASDGRVRDPLWLMKEDSATPAPEEPDPAVRESGGGGGCNAGFGAALLLMGAGASFRYRKR